MYINDWSPEIPSLADKVYQKASTHQKGVDGITPFIVGVLLHFVNTCLVGFRTLYIQSNFLPAWSSVYVHLVV